MDDLFSYLKEKRNATQQSHTPLCDWGKRVQIVPSEMSISALVSEYICQIIAAWHWTWICGWKTRPSGSCFLQLEGKSRRKTLLTVINSCGRCNDSTSDVSKSCTVVLICLTSQRSGHPRDLWHSRRSAEHIPMIRKEKPSAARTHVTACHTATAGLRTSLSHAVAPELTVPNYVSQHPLGFSADKSLSLMANTRLTMWWQNVDNCR